MSATWQSLLDEGIQILTEAGVPDADLDAWYLFEKAYGVDRVHFYMDRNRPLHESQVEKGYESYKEMLSRRAERIPLQQILESQNFMGLDFYVNEHVLIPRQDTETLVEEVLKDCKNPEVKLLDMCTGSGCIGISLAVLGGYRNVTCVDISKDALVVARKNARKMFLIQKGSTRSKGMLKSENPWIMEFMSIVHETVRRLYLVHSDLFKNFEPDKYDIVVSNPPYIPTAVIEGLEPEVRDHEPRIALDGESDGLFFYRVLAIECSYHMNKGGRIYFEIGHDQGADVANILRIAGYKDIEVIKDAPGNDRVVKAVWMGI